VQKFSYLGVAQRTARPGHSPPTKRQSYDGTRHRRRAVICLSGSSRMLADAISADHTGQCIFIVTLCRLVALRAAWLIHQLASSPLTNAMLFPRMAHRHNAAVPGLEVSRGDVLQHHLVQAQLSYQTLQLRVLLLQLFQPPRPVHLQNRHAPCVIGSRSAP
jgi:hypothetical protein